MAFEPLARENPDEAIEHQTDAVVSEAGVVGARLSGNPGPQDWINHMSAADVRQQIGEEIWNSYLKFCAIRNPWDKVVSMFHYLDPAVRRAEGTEIVRRFRGWLPEARDVGQDRSVYCIDGEPVLDAVIRHDQIEADTFALMKHFGHEGRDLPKVKMHHRRNVSLSYQSYYDEGCRDIVRDRFSREIDHFGWSFESLAPEFPGASDDPRFMEPCVEGETP